MSTLTSRSYIFQSFVAVFNWDSTAQHTHLSTAVANVPWGFLESFFVCLFVLHVYLKEFRFNSVCQSMSRNEQINKMIHCLFRLFRKLSKYSNTSLNSPFCNLTLYCNYYTCCSSLYLWPIEKGIAIYTLYIKSVNHLQNTPTKTLVQTRSHGALCHKRNDEEEKTV